MKDVVEYGYFEKLDLRVGKVVGAETPDWSTKLLRFEVDFGSEIGKRIIFSGIRKWYSADDLLGKNFVFLINMQAKKMGDEESQGMMLMVDGKDKPVIIPAPDEVGVGEVVR